jgi:WD40 repeat protein
MRHVIPFVFLAALSLPAIAEPPPPQQPFLRIEAGMHIAAAFSASFSADGKMLATASADRTVRLWNTEDGTLIKVLRPPVDNEMGAETREAALSPDGKLLATSGPSGEDDLYGKKAYLYIFDTATGAIVQRSGPLADNIQDIEFSHDGKYIAAGLVNNGIHLWQAPFTATPLSDDSFGDYRQVMDIDFDREGLLLAAAEDGTVRIYDMDLKALAKATLPHNASPLSISVSPDRTRLAIGYKGEPRIDILSLPEFKKTGSPDLSFAGFGDLGQLAWSADGETLYASGTYYDAGLDKFMVYAFDGKGLAPARQLTSTQGNVLDLVSTNPKGAIFTSGDPAIVGIDGNRMFIGPVAADMSNKLGEHFLVSDDGLSVRFKADYAGKDPWLFDAAKLKLSPSPEAPAGFLKPDVTSFNITNWEDTAEPTLNGGPMPMFPSDFSHAIAIAPDKKSFLHATSGYLIRYDPQGGVLWRQPAPAEGWGANVSGDGKLALAAFGDGTIRWYRMADGEPLLSLFMHRASKRWIAWTPKGYYTASPGGEDLIGWVVNGKSWTDTPTFYPASRFRDTFYRPDVVERVLKLRNEAEAVEEAGGAGEQQPVEALLPASVTISNTGRAIETEAREVTLTYSLASPTGREVTRIEARIDGRPIATRGVAESSAYPLGEELELTVTVPPRNAELSLIAFIGDQPGVAATIPIIWKGTSNEPKKGNLVALLVGVSDYEDETMRLNYAAKDARDLEEALKAQEGAFYDKVEITTLTDRDASKSAIEKQLALMKKKVTENDTALVFFAGHGMTDAAHDFYYLSADATMDVDLLEASAVQGRLIRKSLAAIPGRVVLMMDTCRSGAGITGVVDMSRAANDMAQDTAGIVMFASSQGREDSLESQAWENGAFTEALLSIIDDPAVYGDDGRLSIPELEEAVTVRVGDLTEGRQNAGMTKYGSTPRFFIAALKGR